MSFIIKDIDNVITDLKVERYSLCNYSFSSHAKEDRNEIYDINLWFPYKNSIHKSNTLYHLVSLAQMNPPIILNPSINEDNYYPAFWYCQHLRDYLSDVVFPGNKTPAFWMEENNHFFLALQKDHNFSRFEEFLEYLLNLGGVKFTIFYQEK
jgi:hypothetical protein